MGGAAAGIALWSAGIADHRLDRGIAVSFDRKIQIVNLCASPVPGDCHPDGRFVAAICELTVFRCNCDMVQLDESVIRGCRCDRADSGAAWSSVAAAHHMADNLLVGGGGGLRDFHRISDRRRKQEIREIICLVLHMDRRDCGDPDDVAIPKCC